MSSIRQGLGESLGEDMYEAQKNSTDIPVAIMDDVNDSHQSKMIKQLIRDMTSLDPSQRPKLQQVWEQILDAQTEAEVIEVEDRTGHHKCCIFAVSFFVALLSMIAFVFLCNGCIQSAWKSTANSMLSFAIHNEHCDYAGLFINIGADVNGIEYAEFTPGIPQGNKNPCEDQKTLYVQMMRKIIP